MVLMMEQAEWEYRPLANTMAFSTMSTERMVIKPGGNIGIGTSLPTSTLHVGGELRLEDGFDGSNSAGSSGQVLSSTGTSTEWISRQAPQKNKIVLQQLVVIGIE